jgi:hypothetical protein
MYLVTFITCDLLSHIQTFMHSSYALIRRICHPLETPNFGQVPSFQIYNWEHLFFNLAAELEANRGNIFLQVSRGYDYL